MSKQAVVGTLFVAIRQGVLQEPRTPPGNDVNVIFVGNPANRGVGDSDRIMKCRHFPNWMASRPPR